MSLIALLPNLIPLLLAWFIFVWPTKRYRAQLAEVIGRTKTLRTELTQQAQWAGGRAYIFFYTGVVVLSIIAWLWAVNSGVSLVGGGLLFILFVPTFVPGLIGAAMCFGYAVSTAARIRHTYTTAMALQQRYPKRTTVANLIAYFEGSEGRSLRSISFVLAVTGVVLTGIALLVPLLLYIFDTSTLNLTW